MASQGGTYITDPGGSGSFRPPDHGGAQSRHGWGGSNAGDFMARGGNSAYGVTPSLSGTSGPVAGGNGLAERAPGLSSPPAEPSRPLTQVLSLAHFEIGDERWPQSRELQRAGDEARPNEGEDLPPKPAPSLWTGEDAARLVTALNEVQAKARERAGHLTSCINKLDRWQNQVANRKRKKEVQASGGSLSSGNVGSAPFQGGETGRGAAPGPAKKLRTSLVDVGAARPAKGTWGAPPAGWDSPRGVTNSANTESEEGGDPEWDGNRSKKKRTRKPEANGDAGWHEEPARGSGFKGEGEKSKVGKVWLGKNTQGGTVSKGIEKRVGSTASPNKRPDLGKTRTGDSPTKYAFLSSETENWPRGVSDREEKRTPGKERDREGGVAKGMRGPRTGVGGPNAAHLIRLKSFTSEGRNPDSPRGVMKKPPPSGPVAGERKKSPLGGEKKRPASRSPSPSPGGGKNPNKVARLARTNSAALKLLRDEYVYPAEKPLSWSKEKKSVNAPSGDWRKSPKGGVLKVEKEGLVIEAPDGAHISVLKKSHKKGGSAQYRKDMAAIANRLRLDKNSAFEIGAIREEDDATESEPKKKKKNNFARGGGVKRGGRTSRLARHSKAPEDEIEGPESRNGDATPSSADQEGGREGGLDSWGKPVRSKRTTRQGPDRAAKKMLVGGMQEESEAESDEELETELVVAFETLPQCLQERISSEFWREVEPYFAFLKEEDLQFLRENFRELKEGDVILSVPRCGEHFRKMWANEDQAWRFLVDDNPKTPVGDESEEASGAEAWLERAKKVALSHRLLAALIDEEEPAEGKEEEKALQALPAPAEDPPPTSSGGIPLQNQVSLSESVGGANGITEGPSGRPEGLGSEAPQSKEGEKSVEKDSDPAVSATAQGVHEGAESAAADSRGLDERIQGLAGLIPKSIQGLAGLVPESLQGLAKVEPEMSGQEEGGSGNPLDHPPDGGLIVPGSEDEDVDIVNEVEVAKGAGNDVERSAWEQKFDAMTLDERIRWELQSIGLVDEKEEEPEEREDDPVCFELRSLQRQLREQLEADNGRLEALEQKATAERANEEREREKWALYHFLEKLYERRKGARAGLGPGSSKGGKGTAQKKVAAKEAFLATARRALRKVAQFESGGSVVPRGLNRKWEEKARAQQASDYEEAAPTPTDVQARRASRGIPLAVKDDRKAKQIVGEYPDANFGVPALPVVHSKGQRTKLTKRANKGKRKAGFGRVLAPNGFGGEKELDLEQMRAQEEDILAEAQATAAAAEAAARAEAEQQAAALSIGPANFEDVNLDFSALPLPIDMAGLGDDAFGGGFEGFEFMGAEFNELDELDKFGLDDLGDMGF